MRAAILLSATLLAAVSAGCSSDGEPSATTTAASTPPVTAGPVAATELVPGDCVTGLVIGASERARIESASIVGCDQSHELEVFATFELTPTDFETEGDAYPGQQRIVSAADLGCGTRSEALGEVSESIGLITVWPTQQSWTQGDRTVACAAYSITGTLFGQELRPS